MDASTIFMRCGMIINTLNIINFFHIRQEGEEFHKGFNFYPLTDKGSFGFIFRYDLKNSSTDFESKYFWFRYSKIRKNWIIKIE